MTFGMVPTIFEGRFPKKKNVQAEPCPPRAIFNNEAHGVILGVRMPFDTWGLKITPG